MGDKGSKVVVVTESEVAAAKSQVASDKARGIESDPAIVAIAHATPRRRRGPTLGRRAVS